MLNDYMDRDAGSDCSCPLPYVLKRMNPVLGIYTELRLCCLMEALAATMPDQKFYTVIQEEPEVEWNSEKEPAQFMQDRMTAKGIEWTIT